VLNRLRGRIRVQADGQLKTGRDVAIGCAAGRRRIRLRHRAAGDHGLHHDAQVPPEHLPGGRGHPGPGAAPRSFSGKPEHVVNFFFFVAEEVRQIMAQLGIRTSTS
jgi:glutamate synthase (NADPH/NADH) large chain